MLDSKNETSECSYSFDGPVSFETLDNINDERLLKKCIYMRRLDFRDKCPKNS